MIHISQGMFSQGLRPPIFVVGDEGPKTHGNATTYVVKKMDIWLVVDLPLWKMMEWKSVGRMTFPIWKNKVHVPNHQPNINGFLMDIVGACEMQWTLENCKWTAYNLPSWTWCSTMFYLHNGWTNPCSNGVKIRFNDSNVIRLGSDWLLHIKCWNMLESRVGQPFKDVIK